MHKSPLVAVLIATYNGEAFLKQQLDSILNQTYSNIKIYISDDNSSDTTVQIIENYKEKFPDKIFYTLNKSNVGVVKNFENLIFNCQEEYMALSDQDDIWQVNKLKKQMDAMLELESENISLPCLVNSDLSMIDEKEQMTHQSYFKFRNYVLSDKRYLGHILVPSGIMGNILLMIKRLKHSTLPFPDALDRHDYWLGLHAELFGKRKTIQEQLVQYRIHNDNISNSKSIIKKNKMSIKRDIKLPNMETNRKLFLPKLIGRITSKEDLKTVNAYIDYLKFNKNRLSLYCDLIYFSLVKKSLLFRMKLLLKLLFTNRYNKV